MALSQVTYTGNGVTQTFSLTFNYLNRSHVKVFVNGVEDTTFTWATASTVTLSSVPPVGAVVLIERVTPTAPIVDFVDGSNLTEVMLDTATRQGIYIAEETQDEAVNSLRYESTSNTYPAGNRRITNVANPVNAQDVVTRNWAETAMTSQLTQAQASATSASASATSATNSATSASTSASTATAQAGIATTKANEASASASAASTSASQAASSATAASTSATNASASASTATTQANNASTSASAAATSASNASASASAASTSATNAANSATSASNSATSASNSASSASASASSASASATTATNQATSASTSATNAANSASAASTSATNAANSASSASTSASNASTSATNAANSATSAANSATSAANSLDAFDDRYLGSKASAPTVDNDGNALLEGALYWNTVSKALFIWNGTAWASTATAGVTSFNSRTGTVSLTSGDVTGALGYTPLNPSNNLSDLSNSATARTNLGLGTLATHGDGDKGDITVSSGGTVWTLDSVITAGSVGSSSAIPVITYDAKGRITGVSTATFTAGGFSNIQVFTSSGTFTVPAGVTKVKVTVVGGGGGGGNASGANGQRGCGGGGGGAAIKIVSGLTSGQTVSVTVGGGGGAASAGGTSSFGAYCSATGGEAGITNVTYATGGNGGIGSGGDLNIRGGANTYAGVAYNAGGSSILSSTSPVPRSSIPGGGADGYANGGGGGGAYTSTTATQTGGTGGNGVVIVEW